jgi:hypothetical protein
MCYLYECVAIVRPQALECCQHELNLEFLHDLHHGITIDEVTYIQKMSLLALNGGLWGDFTTIY